MTPPRENGAASGAKTAPDIAERVQALLPMIAAHAALLAWKSGKPVKIVYDRAEDMVATTKRHPSRTRHRTGVTRDGKLVAMDIDFVIDGGAYATLSSVVLSRGTIHAPGPYFCPNVRVRGQAVATNTPPHGAFRGFGAPQSIFALERHLDQVARAVNLTPEEFRRRNFIRKGQTTATGQVIHEDVNFDALLDRAFRESDFYAKRERFALREHICKQHVVMASKRIQRFRKRDEIARDELGPLVDHLVEGMLAIGARFSPVNGFGLVGDPGAIKRDRLAITFHGQLL
jgi:CO/xanthine dehydrogenase Mo-binding subunit